MYLRDNLKLELKPNYQIFPVDKRGIDFVGYKSFHTHILVRDTIKRKFIKMIRRNYNTKSVDSYNGWFLHGNCVNLKNKYIMKYEK